MQQAHGEPARGHDGAARHALMTGLVAATASTDTTGPDGHDQLARVAARRSPTARRSPSRGTATDVGGRVAGVEVSTDGGATWHPATGTTAWSYTYVQSGLGSTPVRVRAIDDSANIGADRHAGRSPWRARARSSGRRSRRSRPRTTRRGRAGPDSSRRPATASSPGVRFYKGSGQHRARTSARCGAPPARGSRPRPSTNESATGWQTATFVAVGPGHGRDDVRRVVHGSRRALRACRTTRSGTAGVSAPPLQVAGGFGASGAGTFGAPGTFPAESFRSTQLLRRRRLLVRRHHTPDHQRPVAARPAPPACPSARRSASVLSKAVTAGSVAMTLTTQGGAAVAGTTSYDATTRRGHVHAVGRARPRRPRTRRRSARRPTGPASRARSTWSFTTAAPAQVAGRPHGQPLRRLGRPRHAPGRRTRTP